MRLEEIDLKGYGGFLRERAAFEVRGAEVPLPWDYVYLNDAMLLRVRHDGGGYLQIDPPGGPAMFRQEREQPPAMLVWVVSGKGKDKEAFTNFWSPTMPVDPSGKSPSHFTCRFLPEAARYELIHHDWRVCTELWVPGDVPAMVMTVRVQNLAARGRTCEVIPALKPSLVTMIQEPWDVPWLYQTGAYFESGSVSGVWMETRDPGGDPSGRLRAALVTDMRPERFEVSADRFEGTGRWGYPAQVWTGRLGKPRTPTRYGRVGPTNAVIGQPMVAAMSRKVTLGAKRELRFTLVFGKLPATGDGRLPSVSEVHKLARYLPIQERRQGLEKARARYAQLMDRRGITIPDKSLERYVNEWLAVQLDWVTRLDRGWPTGMRGTRDAAQDATAAAAIDATTARGRLLELYSVQRADGWFPRQYSTDGRHGRHDLREYVDSGLWVWELLWEYLCYQRDFGLLERRLPWLDSERESLLLDHALRGVGYFVEKKNLGEHGLCKIRGGDWNDSVCRAGLEGRGESVMVSCQAVMALEQAADLLEYLERGKGKARVFRRSAARLRAALRKEAFNHEGYFNGVFTDAGEWVFSPRDPDRRRRVNGPANSFAVIAGVAKDKERQRVMRALNGLKGPWGWRLFYPAIGEPPIRKLGRLGQGDLAPGLGENATVYNHGAQGFLGRAAWTAGRGEMLYQVLRHMVPYEQGIHPVETAKTAPYAMVNHWRESMGQEGVGGDMFLSGSIGVALRNVYDGMVGFRPGLRGVVIDPCLPATWKKLEACVPYLGGRCRVEVVNETGVECGVSMVKVDGKEVKSREWDARLMREVAVIPTTRLARGKERRIEVRLGRRPG